MFIITQLNTDLNSVYNGADGLTDAYNVPTANRWYRGNRNAMTRIPADLDVSESSIIMVKLIQTSTAEYLSSAYILYDLNSNSYYYSVYNTATKEIIPWEKIISSTDLLDYVPRNI